ncbi:MAG: hypothetical protein JSV88_08440 [Candidatus Aminicenantes bacterium]|nr:MAG: hypothetical protein JSV88_08440 [Candidatus Aminicenantes bacterium]
MKKNTGLILLLFTLVVSAIIPNTGCKADHRFDIRGTWVITLVYSDGNQTSNIYVFSGSKFDGTVRIENINSTGSYTVDGNNIQFSVSYGITTPFFSNNFSGAPVAGDYMRGSFNITINDAVTHTGTWDAAKELP